MKYLLLCIFIVGCGWLKVEDEPIVQTSSIESIEENTEFSEEEMKLGLSVCNLLQDKNRLARLDRLSKSSQRVGFSVNRLACDPFRNVATIQNVRANVNRNYSLNSKHSRGYLLMSPYLFADQGAMGLFCPDFRSQTPELERTFDLKSKFTSLALAKLPNGKIKLLIKNRDVTDERALSRIYLIETSGSMRGEAIELLQKKPCADDSAKFEETFQKLTYFPAL